MVILVEVYSLLWERVMLRPEALDLLNELTTTSDILHSATHINLYLAKDGQTRMIVHTELDFEQRELLRFLVNKRNLKLLESPNSVWTIY
jgi:hypothetical protein